ncbi:MAG: hypothetical protein EHM58_11235 [Ignavibacteriae bacterium]|nr:MAG: hypothetical protein EHM58_11235 [Ignavibacteriota bacterium]
MKKEWLSNFLSPGDLDKIKEEINNVERRTCGEIRLSLRDKRNFFEKLYKCHELAVRDFEKMGMTNTKNKTGILVFIVFGERYYDILADEGIYNKIPDSTWNNLEAKLKEEFRSGNYLTGILQIIDRMGDALCREFPREDDDVNELSDEVVVH